LVLDSAVYFEFPGDAVLAPGQFYVVASKPSSFYRAYGLVPSGNYKRNFSNGGEEILLVDSKDNVLINFTYSDDAPWPEYADGSGYSLVSSSRNPDGDPSEYSYWRSSGMHWGSPFADDFFPAGENQPEPLLPSIRLYPNPTSGSVYIDLPESEENTESRLALFGINGKLLYQDVITDSGSLDLKGLNLNSGIYIIRIRTSSQIHTEKIILR